MDGILAVSAIPAVGSSSSLEPKGERSPIMQALSEVGLGVSDLSAASGVAGNIRPQGANFTQESARDLMVLLDAVLTVLADEDPEAQGMIALAIGASGVDQKLSTMKNTNARKIQGEIAKVAADLEAAIKAEKAEEEKNSPLMKAFKWVAIIISAIIAAVMVVASGGIATAAAAAMMLGICALTLMSEISNEVAQSKGKMGDEGVIPSFDKVCGMLCGAIAKSTGASDAEVEKAKNYGGLALSIFIQVGLGFGAGAASAASSATKIAQVGENLAAAGAKGFSSSSKAAIKESGELMLKVETDFFQKMGRNLLKFAKEGADTKTVGTMLRKALFWMTGAQLLAQTGESIGTIKCGVADKEMADSAAEVVTREVLLKWLSDQCELEAEEAKELMEELERMMKTVTGMVHNKAKLLSDIITTPDTTPFAAS